MKAFVIPVSCVRSSDFDVLQQLQYRLQSFKKVQSNANWIDLSFASHEWQIVKSRWLVHSEETVELFVFNLINNAMIVFEPQLISVPCQHPNHYQGQNNDLQSAFQHTEDTLPSPEEAIPLPSVRHG